MFPSTNAKIGNSYSAVLSCGDMLSPATQSARDAQEAEPESPSFFVSGPELLWQKMVLNFSVMPVKCTANGDRT